MNTKKDVLQQNQQKTQSRNTAFSRKQMKTRLGTKKKQKKTKKKKKKKKKKQHNCNNRNVNKEEIQHRNQLGNGQQKKKKLLEKLKLDSLRKHAYSNILKILQP